MAGIMKSRWFEKKADSQITANELPEAFEAEISSIETTQFNSNFGKVFMTKMYQRILTEAGARASMPKGVDKSAYTLTLNDSYSPAKRGLVSLIIKSMSERSLDYYKIETTPRGDKIFTTPVNNEHLDSNGNVKPGYLELDFREFYEGEVVEMLFSLMGTVMQAMSNGVAVSQATLVKLHNLSEMIHNEQNVEPLLAQIRQMEESIRLGKPGVIDAKSDITYAAYETDPTTQATTFIFSMISCITGMPNSYIFGEVVGGLGDNSESDEKRLNSAVRHYFNSILSGVLYVVFKNVFEYKQLVEDIPSLMELLSWIETTNVLTEEGKIKLLIDNTPLSEDFIDLSMSMKMQEAVLNEQVNLSSSNRPDMA